MEIKYIDLLPEGHKKAEEFDKADWSKVNIGDTVEMINIFSYRVVYFRKIFAKAQERADILKCSIKAFQKKENVTGLLCIQFSVAEGGPVKVFSGAPKHRGQVQSEDIKVEDGWNLVSIPFYPDGEPQPSEE